MKPSPLRELIYYALDNNGDSVVAGPLVFKPSKKLAKRFTGPTSVEQLEQSHPFMAPALAAVVPRNSILSQTLRQGDTMPNVADGSVLGDDCKLYSAQQRWAVQAR
jgi:hypothetical protein